MRPSASTTPARIFVPPRSTPITRLAATARGTLLRRMPSEEKPYRVYRGGRTKGKVPAPARPGRRRERQGRPGRVPRARLAPAAPFAGTEDRDRARPPARAPRCVGRRELPRLPRRRGEGEQAPRSERAARPRGRSAGAPALARVDDPAPRHRPQQGRRPRGRQALGLDPARPHRSVEAPGRVPLDPT